MIMSKDKPSVLDLIGPLFNRLNLLERGGHKLSLTNLMVMVCIVKVALAPQVSIPEIGALFLSVLNYGHKRYESNKVAKAEIERQSKKDDEHSTLIQNQAAAIESIKEELHKQAKITEEAKQVLASVKMKPRNQI